MITLIQSNFSKSTEPSRDEKEAEISNLSDLMHDYSHLNARRGRIKKIKYLLFCRPPTYTFKQSPKNDWVGFASEDLIAAPRATTVLLRSDIKKDE